jgi:hypothetical protein
MWDTTGSHERVCQGHEIRLRVPLKQRQLCDNLSGAGGSARRPHGKAQDVGTSNNAEQPQDEDQDQYPAKTDIHRITPVLLLVLKRQGRARRSTRYESVTNLKGIILPIEKVPDLLDFLAPSRK